MKATVLQIPMDRVLRFDLDTYHKLGNLGMIPRNTELIFGVVVYKITISPQPVRFVLKFRDLLTRNLPPNYLVRQESPLTIQDSEPEPDISVVKGDYDDFLEDHPHTAEFVVEVAYSSLEDDLRKVPIYARANIWEYWIFDLLNKKILIFQNPLNGKYVTQKEISGLETIQIPLPTVNPVHISFNDLV
jgi:hypothetical protein